jgi:hypothetical protein
VHVVWRFKLNPDNTAIPILTAIGDILGIGLLLLCFHFAFLTGNEEIRTKHGNGSADSFNSTLYFNKNSTSSMSPKSFQLF